MGRLLQGSEVVELRSDLGGGKTTFVRGLVRGLGSAGPVTSPTFTLSKVYKIKRGELHHFDFYRLDEPGVLAEQLAESLQKSDAITAVEWSQIVEDLLPKKRFIIEITDRPLNEEERNIKVLYPEEKTELIKSLETAWQESQP